ncbi:hypothetical protein TSMEX_009146 [Taenia solium]|eukprot:TsM_000136900 transcript=TsM_000136900 gene=TsM_000136900
MTHQQHKVNDKADKSTNLEFAVIDRIKYQGHSTKCILRNNTKISVANIIRVKTYTYVSLNDYFHKALSLMTSTMTPSLCLLWSRKKSQSYGKRFNTDVKYN